MDALDIYLTPGTRDDGGRSILDAALGDARGAMKNQVLWLGTLGYLVVIEAIGSSVKPTGSSRMPTDSPSSKFVAGTREFSPTPVNRDQANTLLRLRNALAHEFSLRNSTESPAMRFVLDTKGPMIVPADTPWDGTTRPDPYDDMTERRRHATAINVSEVASYVEALVANLRSEHAQGRVALLPDPLDILAFGQFYVD